MDKFDGQMTDIDVFIQSPCWAGIHMHAGDPWGALQYVVDAGGIAEEGTYPYTAEPGFCRTLGGGGNQSSAAAEEVVPLLVGRFSQVLQVPPRDDKALMEVLLRHGPVSVAIDPQPDFIFYSDGVYFNRKCGTAVEDLTHGVVLMGYGTTDDGVEYWVIKNSWSSDWGMNGVDGCVGVVPKRVCCMERQRRRRRATSSSKPPAAASLACASGLLHLASECLSHRLRSKLSRSVPMHRPWGS
ncbi:hypothetical protein PLESTB_001300900 [Pleodorina starrii]|uniref:Peptidase C1A papain C-terminal domain-containing protein n=1 Tax=Pleodorina starrii TaxID=330485 RepID=A0A9W6F6X6_9CHLO|nr:hypothetical protein PLESTB_001300900 [Pleodorina starrii]